MQPLPRALWTGWAAGQTTAGQQDKAEGKGQGKGNAAFSNAVLLLFRPSSSSLCTAGICIIIEGLSLLLYVSILYIDTV